MLAWPDATTVREALARWTRGICRERADIQRVGYAGSYARGDWGVGSDVDVIIVLQSSPVPFDRRSAEWDSTSLPVPADLLVYTRDEWEGLTRTQPRFAATLRREIRWLYPAEAAPGG